MIQRTPAAKARVKVTFVLPGDTPPASVVGDFNGWDPHAHPMRRRSDGSRSASVEVPRGTTLRFRYLLDGGEWRDDPDGQVMSTDDGDRCTVITV